MAAVKPTDANANCKVVQYSTTNTQVSQESAIYWCTPHTTHHTPRHRQSLPMYCMYNTLYIYCKYHICSCQSLPQETLSEHFPLRPLTPFSPPSRLSPFIMLFKKLQEWNQLEQGRRMVKRRRNRWVGTGTGFCFPAREGASPIGSSHAHTHGYGRKAWRRLGWRKKEEWRNS